MDNKFSDIKSTNESIISGVNMIYHIYYILIVYSNNIKLTIFLLERAILLYTEFIIMSQDKSVVEEIDYLKDYIFYEWLQKHTKNITNYESLINVHILFDIDIDIDTDSSISINSNYNKIKLQNVMSKYGFMFV